MRDLNHSQHPGQREEHSDRENTGRKGGSYRFDGAGPDRPAGEKHAHPEHRHGSHRPDGSGTGNPSEEQHGHLGHGRGGRNFWSDWHDERHHHGHGGDIPLGQALSPKEMEAWREFFHQSFGTWPEDHWIFGGRRFSPWHQGMETFNPFVATLLSKGGGLLPLYVLHLISQKPRYGNEIMDQLAERTNGQWVSNPGAIYPLLNLLEKEGFIDGKWEDPDKRTVRIYTIAPLGQAEVSRIEMIVMPKLTETLQVLQDLISDLQAGSANNEAVLPADEPAAG
jgi:DNA-binding PadR family transcriptional regulator